MSRLELVIMAGNESKGFLSDLTKQIDRLEKLYGKVGSAAAASAEEEEEESTEASAATEDDGEEDFTTKPAGKKAASFDEEEEEEAPAPKGKSAKGKEKVAKITLDDVNDAAKALALANGGGKAGREVVVKLLKKHFKTETLSDIDEDNYPAVMKVLKA